MARRTILRAAGFAAAVIILVSTVPAVAVGPYCSDYCAPYRPCSETCYDDEGFKTDCGDWGELPCGVCVPTTYWFGTSAGDTHYGTSANDYINGLSGGDTLYGESGNDYIRGGDGDDTIYGRSGDDCLYGEAGNDYLNGESGHDFCYTGETYVSCND